jgi:zinc/manganese transport system substrate-binding protein
MNAYVASRCAKHQHTPAISVCEECGQVEESLAPQVMSALSDVTGQTGFTSTHHQVIELLGRCISFLAPQGLSTESEASARDVAQLIEQIRAENISAVFVENVADPRLVQQIATETGIIVGGKLFPGALSNEDGAAATYLDMMRHNATTIATALTEAKQP